MEVYSGILVTHEGTFHGDLIVNEMVFEESRVEKDEYVITRTFFNAHTHLGDAALREAPRIELERLVGPGGYKHRMLATADLAILREHAIAEVEKSRDEGTSHFLDFREGGKAGLDVVRGVDGVLTLARPESVEEAEEIDSFGFAYSSVRDHDLKLIEDVREVARRRKKVFGIHAGERDCGDVDSALSLQPDLVVHMNMCPEMIREFIEERIPIVSCIRSNAFFGLLNKKSYEFLSEYDLWMLGTDNAMISTASILDEMHFAAYLVGNEGAVLRAAFAGYEIFNISHGYTVFNRNYSFRRTSDPLLTLVRRAGVRDIEKVLLP
ncbi:MAG: amidohydrolase [Archaeoglobus sp.]|uniref:amidohydrolase n=1 Tax=Archaeoglobus sp. TaxID=1872626 RepID=UPI001DF49867|nr:amidohydrolase [Archaeoglobus sp.]MBO8180536.1 amidohydrolase [Archaeoglobus sp.]